MQHSKSHVTIITILHKSSHIVHFRKKFYVWGMLRGKDWNKRLKYKMQELVWESCRLMSKERDV